MKAPFAAVSGRPKLPEGRGYRQRINALAVSLIIAVAAHSGAQVPQMPELSPVASIVASGGELMNFVMGNRGPVTLTNIFDVAFFSDPPAIMPMGQGVNNVAPIPGSPDPSAQMFDGYTRQTGVQQGTIGQGQGSVFLVGSNVVSLVIPCYCDVGIGWFDTPDLNFLPSIFQYYSYEDPLAWSHIHYELGVEAQSNTTPATTTSPPNSPPDSPSATLPIVGHNVHVPLVSTAQLSPALIAQNINVIDSKTGASYQVRLITIDNENQITVQNNKDTQVGELLNAGSTVQFPPTWNQLNNAALEIYVAPWDNVDNDGKYYSAPSGYLDTTENGKNDQQGYMVWMPGSGGLPNTVSAEQQRDPNEWPFSWTVQVVLPQVVNTLRVRLYAAIYTTADDFVKSNLPLPLDFREPLISDFPAWTMIGNFENSQPTDFSWFQADWWVNYLNIPDREGLGTIGAEGGDTHLWDYSPPFTVAIQPTQLAQAHILPITILYMPPGNSSTFCWETRNSYSTTMSYGVQQSTQTKTYNSSGSDFNWDEKAGFKFFGVGLSESIQGKSSSKSEIFDSTSDTVNNTEKVTVGQTVIQPLATCSGKVGEPLMTSIYGWPPSDQQDVGNQPFWHDQIVFMLSPVFAVWGNPAASGAQTFSAAHLVGFPSGAGLYQPEVHELYCGWRTGAGWPGPDGGAMLTPQECWELLSLDPFFSLGQWQGAPVQNYGDGYRFVQCGPPHTGVAPNHEAAYNVDTMESDVQANTVTQTSATGSESDWTSSVEANFALTLNVSDGGGVGFGTSSGGGESTTLTVQYQTQNIIDSAKGVDSEVAVLDTGTLKRVTIYWDSLYNSLCVQDTNMASLTSFNGYIDCGPVTFQRQPGLTLNEQQDIESLISPQAPSYAEPTLYPPPLRREPPQFPVLGAPPVHRPPQMLAGPPPYGPVPPSPPPPINRRPPIVPRSPADGLPPNALPPFSPQPPVPVGPGP